MDATPLLIQLTEAFAEANLEVILVGNAAAALQGAPVTTVDLDFYYRETALNRDKLKRVSDILGAELTQPFPQLSSVFRMILPDTSIYVDFLSVMGGVTSLPSLRSRASRVPIEGRILLVASLEDVIRSKKLAGRPKDLAVMYVLEESLARKNQKAQPGPEAGTSTPGE